MVAPPSTSASTGCPARRLELWSIDLDSGREQLIDFGHRHGLALPRPTTDARAAPPRDPAREAARIALRVLLSGHVGSDVARRPFVLARAGKPALDASGGAATVEFSLAHCDSAAIVAISRDGPVGVDIEAPRTVRLAEHRRVMLLAAAARLSPTEDLPVATPEAHFLQARVRLEALAKATGEGLGALLGRLEDSATPLHATRLDRRAVRVRDVRLEPCGGLALFAAVAGTGSALDTGAPPLAAARMPLDPGWLEHCIAGHAPRA